jgi:hypothetical protein
MSAFYFHALKECTYENLGVGAKDGGGSAGRLSDREAGIRVGVASNLRSRSSSSKRREKCGRDRNLGQHLDVDSTRSSWDGDSM